ncbi:MAG: FAD binding 3 protein [Gammaproteobacteria bacterium]|nr:FAD binding 3 protein [Gammaproteobacteria bacterium]
MPGLDAEVIIVGGGLVGASLAGLLGQQGIECIILAADDRSQPLGPIPDPRTLALTQASRQILQSLNVWPRLPGERIGRFRHMHVWDENGKGEIHFDCEDLCAACLGYIVEQEVLQTTLNQILEFIPAVTCRTGAKPVAIHSHDDAVTVELADGQLRAQLLVAADGAHSGTRELAGIGHAVHDYQQTAIACIVKTELPHDDTARQRFLRSGPLAFLPMADPYQCGTVWSTDPDHADQLLTMDAGQFELTLKSAFANTLGAIITSGQRAGFSLQRAQAKRYCKERIVLAGDAAHSVHPLAGQGANLGLLDAACLAEVLLQARKKNRDLGKMRVLRRYERWRKGENRFMMLVFEGFKYLFENQMTPVPLLRNMGLNLVDQNTYIKHFIMRRAMGLTGDLPAVARA